MTCFPPKFDKQSVGMKEANYAHVLNNAKRGPIIDRIGWWTLWVSLWIGVAWSSGIGPLFFGSENFRSAYWVGTLVLALVALAAFMFLKWRQDRLS
jgi:hypothetical protein